MGIVDDKPVIGSPRAEGAGAGGGGDEAAALNKDVRGKRHRDAVEGDGSQVIKEGIQLGPISRGVGGQVKDDDDAKKAEIKAKEAEIKAKEEEIKAKEEEIKAKEGKIEANQEQIEAKEGEVTEVSKARAMARLNGANDKEHDILIEAGNAQLHRLMQIENDLRKDKERLERDKERLERGIERLVASIQDLKQDKERILQERLAIEQLLKAVSVKVDSASFVQQSEMLFAWITVVEVTGLMLSGVFFACLRRAFGRKDQACSGFRRTMSLKSSKVCATNETWTGVSVVVTWCG